MLRRVSVRREVSRAVALRWEPVAFAEVVDVSDVVRRRRMRLVQFMVMRALAALLIASALCVGLFPVVMQVRSARSLSNTSDAVAKTVAGWPYPQAEDRLADARAYNARLAKEGQPILGEAVDPFASAAGVSQSSGNGDSVSSQDEEYQGLLDSGSGIMGTVSIPKISVKLPIYHGTSEQALAKGAGHRGLVEAMMFTRLER